MFRRRLLLLLAMCLVPVVVFSNPQTAQASTITYGSSASTEFSSTWIWGTDYFKCSIKGQWATDGGVSGALKSTLHYGWACDEGSWDSSTSVGLSVPTSNCATSSPLGLVASFSFSGYASGHADQTGSGVFVPSVDPTTYCNVTTLCMSATVHNTPPLSDHSFSSCQDFNAGAPPAVGVATSCTRGTPTQPTLGALEKYIPGDGNRYWGQHTTWGWDAGSTSLDSQWTAYVVVAPANNSFAYSPLGGTVVNKYTAVQIANGQYSTLNTKGWNITHGTTASGVDFPVETGTPWYWSADPGPGAPDGNIVGMGVIAGAIGGIASSGFTVPYNGANPAGLEGLTDPSNCMWYWGAKIADVAGTNTDEPGGPLVSSGPPPTGDTTPPPTTDTGSCSFSLMDPTTWLEGGMCAAVGLLAKLVGLLGDVINVLHDVVTAIGHILDNIASLFQPDPGSWHFSDLKAQWDSRPPGSIVNASVSAIQGVADGLSGGGSCSLAPWVVHADGASYSTARVCPKTYPAYLAVYELVAAGLMVLTGIYCFRLVRSVVGSGGGGS